MGRAIDVGEFVAGFTAGASQQGLHADASEAMKDGWSVGRQAVRHAVAMYLDERGYEQLGSQSLSDFVSSEEGS